MRVVVVGGGLAGLTAAIAANDVGHAVTLVDEAELGGKAQTIEAAPGWRVERGPHSFTGRADALRGLVDRLGLGARVEPTAPAARSRFLVRGGALVRAGPGLLASWAVISGMFKRVEDADDASVWDWFAARLGPAFADGPLGAMCAGIWATDPRRVEMAAGFPTIHALVRQQGSIAGAALARERSATGTFTVHGGLGAIAGAARAALGPSRVHGGRVSGVRRAGASWIVTVDAVEIPADHVIVACDAGRAGDLLAGVAPAACAALAEVEYAPLLVAHWLAKDARYPAGFGFLAEPASRIGSLGTLFVSDALPGRAPAGSRSFASMFADPRATDDEARATVEAEHEALTGARVTLDGLHVIRHPRAVALPAPGHAARVARVRAGLPAGLHVAGSYLGGGAMDDAVRSGTVAAGELGPAGRA